MEIEDEPPSVASATLLSLFFPGTGQLALGSVAWGFIFFIPWALAWITHLTPVWMGLCVASAGHAFWASRKANKSAKSVP